MTLVRETGLRPAGKEDELIELVEDRNINDQRWPSLSLSSHGPASARFIFWSFFADLAGMTTPGHGQSGDLASETPGLECLTRV